MTERDVSLAQFDADAASAALTTSHQPIHDVAYGDGHELSNDSTVLEVYPASGVVRVTTEDARIELFRSPEIVIQDERVVFEHGPSDSRSRLLLRPGGRVSYFPVIRAATTAGTAATNETVSTPPTPTSETSTAPHTATRGATAKAEQREEPVEISGRLGRNPWFNDTADNPIARFPLAINDESTGKATWHNVVVFGEAATQMRKQGAIRQGRTVTVTGQTVEVDDPTPSKPGRKRPEFHATAIAQVTARRGR